jgi:hypothetical protein
MVEKGTAAPAAPQYDRSLYMGWGFAGVEGEVGDGFGLSPLHPDA